ncbi:glutamine synthetase [Actinocrinis puniceicyclus]|uniref:Glutamine synthetase n=1 Tax=Actinocrinis puniceicyclus TaxID=977794 RepID=A0A8J7WNW0_9ACTN|nr:glutamine synthetase family protein [Actinocrinis puniceicyclus]MBS2962880.1 glutamine synthetase [Actinocrinis puniceicyclus]
MSRWGTLEQSWREESAARAEGIAAELAARGVHGVAVTWVDNSGITRVKAVPVEKLARAAAWGIGVSPCFDTFLLDDSAAVARYAGGPVGDLRLMPDLDRLTPLAGQPGWAWAPADRFRQDGSVHPIDQRSLARREVERLAADGYAVRAAFEVEWCVSLGHGDEFEPACAGPAYGMARLIEQSDYVRDVMDALAAQGLTVDQIHPEYAAGQYEVSVAAQDPVGAADTLVLVRETIRAVSHRNGLRATFSPKVLAGGVGNGGHVHLSLWSAGAGEGEGEGAQPARGDGVRNLMSGGSGRFGLTGQGEAFAGGLLAHLPALLALGAPAVASYLRLIPSHWAGAYACWGLENREAALRFVTGSTGDGARAANLELKCFDAAANPYLLIAGLLAAGRAGLAAGAKLPEPVDVDPATLPADEATRRDVRALPSSLEGAVAAFEADEVLAEAFGIEFIDTIATVRRAEIALFADASPQDVVERTRWRH